MNRKILSTLLVCSCTLTSVIMPIAASADDYSNQIEQKDKKIDSLKSQEISVEKKVASLQQKVDEINETAQSLLSKQGELREESTTLQDEIDQLITRIDKRQKAIKNQARDVQVNGGSANYLDVVLNAESVSEAVTRIYAVNTIVSANNNLVKQQKIDKKDVENKKTENDQKLQELQENQVALEAQKGELERAELDLTIEKTSLAADRAKAEDEKDGLLRQKTEAEAERARLNEQTQAAVQAAKKESDQATPKEPSTAPSTGNQATPEVPADDPVQSVTPTPPAGGGSGSTPPSNGGGQVTPPDGGGGSQITPPPSGNSSAVVAEAQRHIGKPYVWGAKGPDAFDCSGFTRYVYLQVTGRDIGGYTVPQESAGARISVAAAQPGDLYFWGTPGGTYHVAIATGGGGYIHAGNESTGVCYGAVGGSFTPDFAVRM